MAIKLVLPPDGTFTISSLQDLIDVVADGSLSNQTATGFTASGTINGTFASAVATGTGLTYFFGYPVGGTLDTLTVTVGSDDVVFTNMNLDVAELAAAIAADQTEAFLLGLDWKMTLGNADDIAPQGTLINGVPFELTGRDNIRGLGGDDNLYTGAGFDRLSGNAGNDTLDGGAGRDTIKGGSGKDVIIGGTGSDVLIGGGAADDFIFADGDGRDVIKDFNAFKKQEDIDLSAVTAIKSFKDLSNNHMQQVGADVVIDDGAGLVITIENIDIGDLDRSDFLF